MPTSNEAFEKLKEFEFRNVLDIGSGKGRHSQAFFEAGKEVHAIDLAPPEKALYTTIKGDYLDFKAMPEEFECIWAAHVLEHQLNVNLFLRKCFNELCDDGVLAITVPPLKHAIVGGHVTLWNMGLLFYNLILAGFDCAEAIGKQYGYNISVIVRKKAAYPAGLCYDSGDIEKLAPYFPRGYKWQQGFNGNLKNIGWE